MNDSVAWNCSSDGMTKNENVCEWSCWKDRCLTEWEWYSPRVSRAITGDTIELTDGRIVKLIGIRAPSIGEPYFEQSRKSLQDYITNNSICLSADEQDRDEEGNFLRYVGLSYNSSYPNYQMPTCPGWNLNRLQLTGGFAYFKPQTPNLKQISELRSIESGAINSNVNIWSFASGWIPTCLDLLDFIWDAQGDDSTNLNGEIVLLKNGCMNPINMTGWYLLDNDGNIYRFPNFILDGGKYARVHSGIGIDNATDLYWNSTVEIWSNDIVWKGSSGSTYRDTLALRDSDGKLYFWQWLS
jgi:endonuclease YncB( thermonuclease family)